MWRLSCHVIRLIKTVALKISKIYSNLSGLIQKVMSLNFQSLTANIIYQTTFIKKNIENWKKSLKNVDVEITIKKYECYELTCIIFSFMLGGSFSILNYSCISRFSLLTPYFGYNIFCLLSIVVWMLYGWIRK